MKNLIKSFILMLSISSFVYAQDTNEEVKTQKDKKPFSFSHGISKVINKQSTGIDVNTGFMVGLNNGWGYGLDFTLSSYTPSSIINTPISEIENFDETTLPVGIRKDFFSGHQEDSKLFSFSPTMFKSISLNYKKSFKLYIQAGASVIYTRDLQYKVRYIPAFSAGLFGGPEKLEYRLSEKNKEIIIGAFSRISLRYAFNNVVGFEFSGYGNLNDTKSVYGLQFGIALGRL